MVGLSCKSVLVTGATGFVGSHLAHNLAKRGHQVRALVRNKEKAKPLKEAGIELRKGDIVCSSDVEAAAEGVQAIYHIAALYRSARHPDRIYRKINVEGTRNVLEAAGKYGVERLIHCSTIGVHGDIKSIPADENAPYDPGDVYQRSKLEGEILVQKAIDRGFPATIFRPVAVYGPGDLRLLKLFKNIYSGRFRMFGSGQSFYHLVYIDDLVEGIILCGERPEAVGRTYILAGPRYTTISELTNLVAEAVGSKKSAGRLLLTPLKFAAKVCEEVCKPFNIEPPLYSRRLDFFYKNRAFKSTRAHQELGYTPRVDLPEGLSLTASWYFDQGFLICKRPDRGKGQGSGHEGKAEKWLSKAR